MQKQPKQRRAEDAAMAKKYNVTDRTIRAWATAGAPLENPDAMPRWIMDHQERGIKKNAPLPGGLEHSNIIRMMVESALSDFLYRCSNHVIETLVDELKGKGIDAKFAEGSGFVVWYGLLHQLKHYTMGDRFNRALMAQDGQSLDSALRDLLPQWKEASAPPSRFPKQPIPPAVRKWFKEMGHGDHPYADISGEGGVTLSDSPHHT